MTRVTTPRLTRQPARGADTIVDTVTGAGARGRTPEEALAVCCCHWGRCEVWARPRSMVRWRPARGLPGGRGTWFKPAELPMLAAEDEGEGGTPHFGETTRSVRS